LNDTPFAEHCTVEKMRAALENVHVSEQLHLWIDLIFGFKQRGDEADRADNCM